MVRYGEEMLLRKCYFEQEVLDCIDRLIDHDSEEEGNGQPKPPLQKADNEQRDAMR